MLIILTTLLMTLPAVYNTDTRWQEDHIKKETTILLKLVPNKGWKWNSDYSFKYEIQTKSKEKLKLSWRMFDHQTDAVLFGFGLKKTPKDLQEVNVVLSFSLCNETSCRVWRNKLFLVRRKIN